MDGACPGEHGAPAPSVSEALSPEKSKKRKTQFLRLKSIVPFPVKRITSDVECSRLFIRHFETSGIAVGILDSHHGSSLFGCRMRNQLKNRFQRNERFAASIDGNVRKESMLDFLPFAGSFRQMAHCDRETSLSGQVLYLAFPQAAA